MLFDLEDYINAGVIGNNQLPATGINWEDTYSTARSTRDNHIKAVMDYFRVAINFVPLEQRPTAIQKWDEWTAATFALSPILYNYWNAVISIQILGVFNEGDHYYKLQLPAYESEGVLVDYSSLGYALVTEPKRYPWSNDSWDYYFVFAYQYTEDTSAFEYKTLTQELQDQYGAAIEAVMLAEKELVLSLEGPDFLQDYQP